MLNEMRDFYKALCRTVTGTMFKLISISKKCSAKLCCSYDVTSPNNNTIYFEVTIKHGNIVSTYLHDRLGNIPNLTLNTKEDGDKIEIYFGAKSEINLTVKTEVDFGTVSSFTVTATKIPADCVVYTMNAGNNMGKNIVGLDFAQEKITTDYSKYQGIDLRQYIHHTIEYDYPYDGTYKDIETQEAAE